MSGSSEEPGAGAHGGLGAGHDDAGHDDAAQDEGAAQDEALGEVEDAAATALSRARAVAAGRGLRPGMKPRRRRVRRGMEPEGSAIPTGRDPELLGDQIERMIADRGWRTDVAAGSVMSRWPDLVGSQVAEHSAPVSFEDGVLTVRADSTAWATQLRLLTSSILGRLAEEVGPETVVELRVVGPSAPSWKKGPRRAPGMRGPRDTYG